MISQIWKWHHRSTRKPTRFPQVTGNLPVFTATRTAKLPVHAHGNGVSLNTKWAFGRLNSCLWPELIDSEDMPDDKNWNNRFFDNCNILFQERGTSTEPPPRANFSATANQVGLDDPGVDCFIP